MPDGTSGVYTFYPEFSEYVALYRGVVRVWIGDGETTGEVGVLYAEYVDSEVQRIGPVSSYAEAVQSGKAGEGTPYPTEESWIQHIIDTTQHALDAEAWAVGKEGGVDVDSSHKTYHNNAEYYAQQSHGWTNNADGAADAWSETNNAKYYSEQAAEHNQSALAAQQAAEDAQGFAEQAQLASEEAQHLSEAAQQAAETAQDLSEQAQSAAETAQGLSEQAKTASETARDESEAAQSRSESARDRAEAAQSASEAAQSAAESAQSKAETAQGLAEAAQTATEIAQGKAEDAQVAAEAAQSVSENAKDTAVSAKNDAVAAKNQAQTAKTEAETAYSNADAAKADTIAARDTAVSAKNNAQTSETNASSSASAAAISATNADTSATNALTSERNAEAYAVGKRNGVDVPPSDITYHNNCEYYSQYMVQKIAEFGDVIQGGTTVYQNSISGTDYPTTGTWTSNPNPEPGKYTWSKTTFQWGGGETTILYNVSYTGANGTGSVNSVNGMGGDVVLDGSSILVNKDAQNHVSILSYTETTDGRIQTINSNISDINAAIAPMSGDISDMKVDIANLQTAISDADIDALFA